jgi:hypothetical protein
MPCPSEQGINTRFRARGDEILENQYPVISAPLYPMRDMEEAAAYDQSAQNHITAVDAIT